MLSTLPAYFFFLCSNNNRSSRKIAGKKFQPLMSPDTAERSHIADGSYSCSPSKQGSLRLKLSSEDFLFQIFLTSTIRLVRISLRRIWKLTLGLTGLQFSVKLWRSKHTTGAYHSFSSKKLLRVFLLLPGWDAGLYQGYPSALNLTVPPTPPYTWVERGIVKITVAQHHFRSPLLIPSC